MLLNMIEFFVNELKKCMPLRKYTGFNGIGWLVEYSEWLRIFTFILSYPILFILNLMWLAMVVLIIVGILVISLVS